MSPVRSSRLRSRRATGRDIDATGADAGVAVDRGHEPRAVAADDHVVADLDLGGLRRAHRDEVALARCSRAGPGTGRRRMASTAPAGTDHRPPPCTGPSWAASVSSPSSGSTARVPQAICSASAMPERQRPTASSRTPCTMPREARNAWTVAASGAGHGIRSTRSRRRTRSRFGGWSSRRKRPPGCRSTERVAAIASRESSAKSSMWGSSSGVVASTDWPYTIGHGRAVGGTPSTSTTTPSCQSSIGSRPPASAGSTTTRPPTTASVPPRARSCVSVRSAIAIHRAYRQIRPAG